MSAKPKTVDEYLAALSDDKRAALEKLRRTIKAAAPGAEELISYGIPSFRLNRMLVGFGAGANHCAFYLMSTAATKAHQADLQQYDTGKGTVRFPPNQPLPAALVKKLVKTRLAENEARSAAAKTKAAPATKRPAAAQEDPAVVAFLEELEHPLKAEALSLRKLILNASPKIREGIKWNSPSFRTSDYFATINLHDKNQIRLILHTGAKPKESAATSLKIADPAGLLQWLAKDRCLVTVNGKRDLQSKRAALRDIVKRWIQSL